jgi:hypothetical protein
LLHRSLTELGVMSSAIAHFARLQETTSHCALTLCHAVFPVLRLPALLCPASPCVSMCARPYSRAGRDSHRVSIEYKGEEASYLHHFSVVNELLRFVYLNICGVSMLSEQNEVFLNQTCSHLYAAQFTSEARNCSIQSFCTTHHCNMFVAMKRT